MSKIIGISAFGLKDSIIDADSTICDSNGCISNAILPVSPMGRIISGPIARFSRIHAGLNWPPDARIESGRSIRRVPIPLAWNALVRAGDRNARWGIGTGISIPVARIIASHIRSLVGTHYLKDVNLHPVIAIPDNLDEYGQEVLLRDLEREGLQNPKLLWRPIAAALSWINQVEGLLAKEICENDHIHVVYMGADEVEFTTLRLKVREYNGNLYVLPLRDRPIYNINQTGFDWAGNVIEGNFTDIDESAFWQSFNMFQEVWEALAGKSENVNRKPRVWSCRNEWRLFEPPLQLCNKIFDAKAGPSRLLRNILSGSIHFDDDVNVSGNIEKILSTKFRRLHDVLPMGKCRGIIICGPLVPAKIPPWIAQEISTFNSHGTFTDATLSHPKLGCTWYCSDGIDPIAIGSSIYGNRSSQGIPSYLDTMPQVSVLAQIGGIYKWVPLLDAREVDGGGEYNERIKHLFKLEQGQNKLHIYLCRGAIEDIPGTFDLYDYRRLPHPEMSAYEARLVREIVKNLGTEDAVKRNSFLRRNYRFAKYSISFGKYYFSKPWSEDNRPQNNESKSVKGKTKYRRADFEFHSNLSEDAILDVAVRMRPASGLAKVDLIPTNNFHFKGWKARLNYSTMKEVEELPRAQRGWPILQEIVADPEDRALRQGSRLVQEFENTPPVNSKYIGVLNDLHQAVITRSIRYSMEIALWVKPIDQDGQACSVEADKVINRISSKFEFDFQRMNRELKNTVFSKAAWLYLSTPNTISEYIRKVLDSNCFAREWLWAADAGSRSFEKIEDFELMFTAIAKRARSRTTSKPFPIQAARAVCQVLMYRMDGDKGLNRKTAELLAVRALEIMKNEAENTNFNTLYFQVIRLLLYLLRFRRADPNCFDPNSPRGIQVFLEALKSMEVALKQVSRNREFSRADRIKRISKGFEDYLYYRGSDDVLPLLNELAGD